MFMDSLPLTLTLYDMAVTSLLGSMMFEKTIKAVATNIRDMN